MYRFHADQRELPDSRPVPYHPKQPKEEINSKKNQVQTSGGIFLVFLFWRQNRLNKSSPHTISQDRALVRRTSKRQAFSLSRRIVEQNRKRRTKTCKLEKDENRSGVFPLPSYCHTSVKHPVPSLTGGYTWEKEGIFGISNVKGQ